MSWISCSQTSWDQFRLSALFAFSPDCITVRRMLTRCMPQCSAQIRSIGVQFAGRFMLALYVQLRCKAHKVWYQDVRPKGLILKLQTCCWYGNDWPSVVKAHFQKHLSWPNSTLHHLTLPAFETLQVDTSSLLEMKVFLDRDFLGLGRPTVTFMNSGQLLAWEITKLLEITWERDPFLQIGVNLWQELALEVSQQNLSWRC